MTRFAVEWGRGKHTELETSECATADQYAMQRWGAASAEEVFDFYGVRIYEDLNAAPPEVQKAAYIEDQKRAAVVKADAIAQAKLG